MNTLGFQKTVKYLVLACMLIAPLGWSAQVQLDAALSHPVLKAGEQSTAYLQVGLTGFDLEREGARPPVNVALVLDKSGSMQGEKIQQAKHAARLAIDRLRPDDIVSVITYDTVVTVVVPATKVMDGRAIRNRIQSINANGSTALFAGVAKGAAEVRKFLSKERVNRVVLLSDGLANVGPDSPADLAELGTSLKVEGISVTTIGLGLDYGEDLMVALAEKSDGNHAFAENTTDLARAFDTEFGDILAVAAQDVSIRIECAGGVRPVRVLGRDARINGQAVTASLSQLYAKQMKYVMLEVEIEGEEAGRERRVANVNVSYANMASNTTERLASTVSVHYSASEAETKQALNKNVMGEAVRQIGMENAEVAIKLRDEGKVEEAAQAFTSNEAFLGQQAVELNNDALRVDSNYNKKAVSVVRDLKAWKGGRKMMKEEAYKAKKQQVSR
jgi:Ca-activated chloride channel homolog